MVFQNQKIYIEIEPSEIPWLKIFTTYPYKEFSQCPNDIKQDIFVALDIIEKNMLKYYNPIKINIASFGNMLPRVHWHIMARFEEDSYFPEPMWGTNQKNRPINIPITDEFLDIIRKDLNQLLK